jgi:hypothetical protein
MRFKNFGLVLLCLIVVSMGVIGCGSGGGASKTNSLTPPDWVQGTWVSQDGLSFEFQKNKIIQSMGGARFTFPEQEGFTFGDC